ncbi:hypothetical protein HZA55_00545 [Candidatus Poribacteria bacterium]|nr:hypothetical protein [Candidatus Poribacteria bacterium]
MFPKINAMKYLFILISLALLVIFKTDLYCDEEQSFENNLSLLSSKKNKASELHLSGKLKESISLYESISLSISLDIKNFENNNKKDFENNSKFRDELRSLQKEIDKHIKNDGFFVDENLIQKEQVYFPDRIEGIISIAWVSQDDIKIFLANPSSNAIDLTVVLGYGWNDGEGDRDVDAIYAEDINLKPSIPAEITFKGIPVQEKKDEEKQFNRIYSHPEFFLILKNNEKSARKIQKLYIQGIVNEYLNFSHLKQYYFRQLAKATFIANVTSENKKNLEVYNLYIKKTANFFSNSYKPGILLSSNNTNIDFEELKSGFVVKNFPTEIAINTSITKSDIDILYFDTMLLEIKTKENVHIKTLNIICPSIILLSKEIKIDTMEKILPGDKTIHLLSDDSAENRIKNLITKLKINYWNISLNAQLELIKMDKDVVPYLLKEVEIDSKLTRQVFEIIGKIGAPALQALIEYTNIITEDVNLQFYEDLAKCYGLIGHQSIEPLASALTREKKISKAIFLCLAFVEINDKSCAPYLIEILKDLNKAVYHVDSADMNYNMLIGRENYLKSIIIHTLGVLKEKKSVPILISLIDIDPSRKVLEEISFALSNMEDPSSFDSLVFLAKEGYPKAIEGMVKINKKALPDLLNKIDKYPIECQIEISKLCIDMGDIMMLDKIMKLSDDVNTDLKVKENFYLAIENIMSKVK